jgi:hypothetical protein
MLISIPALSPWQPLIGLYLISVLISLPFMECHMSDIMQYATFCMVSFV